MPSSPDRFRFLATHIAGTAVGVASAAPDQASYTDGLVIYVTAVDPSTQRRQILVQSALLGAGSLDPQVVKSLRGRPSLAYRYLALEGRRVLADLARTLPLAAGLGIDCSTASSTESLEIASGRATVAPAPDWFGVIKPSKLLDSHRKSGSRATGQDMRLHFDAEAADDEREDENRPDDSEILKLFEAPIGSRALANFLSKMFGGSRTQSNRAAGAESSLGSTRRVGRFGPHIGPLPTRIQFTGDGKPGATIGVGGALHPEWDDHRNRYRPDWCRVIDFPLPADSDVSAAGIPHDDVLRRRLSRIGLGPKVLRGRADGDELDLEALIDLAIDLRCGYSPAEHVYTERRKLARDLGVLILVDASGSANDSDANGRAVHDHQRQAAATLAATLEDLGDRVAVYAFRSQGRHAVHLPAIKTFEHRFGAVARARLNQLQPSGYTRLGAGIRGAGEILKNEAGTPNRLLVVLSDGFSYDDGYEGRYAEADASKALEELRADGVACLCLSIGSDTGAEALERVFGSAGHASAATLAELSPRMDELFLASLRELSAPTGLTRTAR